MYNNGFVLAVRVGDKFVEENLDNFVVPFDSEYSIRLKNRNDRKAVVKLYIDGEEVNKLGKFIMDANGTLDLERFVSDLNEGRKFKFVPVSSAGVKDKNNGENGIIEARFRLVKPVSQPILYNTWDSFKKYEPLRDGNSWYCCDTEMYKDDKLSCSFGGTTSYNTSYSCSLTNTSSIQPSFGEKGATIEGDRSSQKFSYSYIGELEPQETVIRVKLYGTSDPEVKRYYTKIYCPKCSKKYGDSDIYCSGCGDKR